MTRGGYGSWGGGAIAAPSAPDLFFSRTHLNRKILKYTKIIRYIIVGTKCLVFTSMLTVPIVADENALTSHGFSIALTLSCSMFMIHLRMFYKINCHISKFLSKRDQIKETEIPFFLQYFNIFLIYYILNNICRQ